MPTFTTRVELHGAALADYERLHQFMAEARFYRTVVGDDGREYRLPEAEYSSQGELSVFDVRQLAQQAAAKTGKSLLGDGDGGRSAGLDSSAGVSLDRSAAAETPAAATSATVYVAISKK
jgi:hypothetical protein